MTWKTLGLIALALPITACGGGGGNDSVGNGPAAGNSDGGGSLETPIETDPVNPLQGRMGNLPHRTDATYDASTDTLKLDLRGAPVDLTRNNFLPNINGFDQFQAAGAEASALRGTTASGSGSAMIVFSRANAHDIHGVEYERLTPGGIPVTGTATYQGEYVGLITSTSAGAAFVVQGDATLETDFDSGSVNGRVSNRSQVVSGSDNGFFMNDLALRDGSISGNGEFRGTVTGGQAIGDTFFSGSSTTTGSYGGAIVGATGNEAVGGVVIDHEFEGVTMTETGAFVASQP
ncbi:hypothetical protein [uncultured Ruegeria sp.]|uniref:hypothetical protein n=1 Tax=uncultured Ruegeria sp. TaxID=259304 RepID=UPI002637BBC0|nr:hypothetical protein [uncultured Ruegeria sp.]